MPTSKADVLELLSATNTMYNEHATRPLVTMSMAATGVISRLAGEVFGSSMTFGAVGQVSAPGQIPVEQLKTVLDIIHNAL
jgi:3-dehydroquinate dehydratase-1